MKSDEVYDSKLVKEVFFTNMDQILFMWMKVWSSLSNKEKNIVTTLVDNDSLNWSDLLDKCQMSRGSFNNYLKNLRDKGIIEFINGKYFIEDKMLKTWLKHEHEVYGFYPK